MKILKRFLKENNVYNRIINYLCPYGTKENRFYEKIKNGIYLADYGYDFRDILRLRCAIDPSYTELGHNYWEEYIWPVSRRFIEYYSLKVSADALRYKLKES